MTRKIEIIRLGDNYGCCFDDRISIEFSPNEISDIESVFEERALSEKSYCQQGREREMKDLFREAYVKWETAREQKDKKETQNGG